MCDVEALNSVSDNTSRKVEVSFILFVFDALLTSTRAIGYDKQSLLAWSNVEERGWSCLEIRLLIN